MERFSTDALTSAGRVQAWNEIYSGTLAAADFIPEEENFSAGLQMCQVGPVGLAHLATGRCTIRRTAEHIVETSSKLYSFIIQANGRGLFVQGRNQVVLDKGDFALCDHGRPHSRVLEDNAEMLIIRVPAEMIGEYIPDADMHCGRRLPGNVGMASGAGVWARSLWRRLQDGLPKEYETCLAHHLLELIGTSYSLAFGSATERERCDPRTVANVHTYIEDRLHDPDFKPTSIADDMRLAPGEMRALMGRSNESVRSYVLRRRLSEAARRLKDPRWRGHTIAEIAHCCGFTSTAMFSRTFRERYKLSPKVFRTT